MNQRASLAQAASYGSVAKSPLSTLLRSSTTDNDCRTAAYQSTEIKTASRYRKLRTLVCVRADT